MNDKTIKAHKKADNVEDISALKHTKKEKMANAEEAEPLKEGIVQVTIPNFFPTNGRIVCVGAKKQMIKTESGIIKKVYKEIDLNVKEENTRNPYRDTDFYVCAVAPDVNKNLKNTGSLPKIKRINVHGKETTIEMPIEVLDQLVVSEKMEPVVIDDGGDTYFVWYYMDFIGLRKDPKNFNKLLERNKIPQDQWLPTVDPKDLAKKPE